MSRCGCSTNFGSDLAAPPSSNGRTETFGVSDRGSNPRGGMMRGRVRSWTDSQLTSAVASCSCLTDVIRQLGLRPAGGSHASVRSHVERLALDTTHFTLERRTRGLRGHRERARRTSSDIFCEGSGVGSEVLRRSARRFITPYQCMVCGNPGVHNGQSLTLQLHHLNGIFNDNRRENLGWNCPNCHSQSAGFAGRGTRASLRRRSAHRDLHHIFDKAP